MRAVSARQGEVLNLSRARLQNSAKRLIELRQLRTVMLGKTLAREAAWDILLTLYANDYRFTVSRLSKLTNTPVTSVLRWLDYLNARGLIRREEHPTDRRAIFVSLSESGERLLAAYLIETLDDRAFTNSKKSAQLTRV